MPTPVGGLGDDDLARVAVAVARRRLSLRRRGDERLALRVPVRGGVFGRGPTVLDLVGNGRTGWNRQTDGDCHELRVLLHASSCLFLCLCTGEKGPVRTRTLRTIPSITHTEPCKLQGLEPTFSRDFPWAPRRGIQGGRYVAAPCAVCGSALRGMWQLLARYVAMPPLGTKLAFGRGPCLRGPRLSTSSKIDARLMPAGRSDAATVGSRRALLRHPFPG